MTQPESSMLPVLRLKEVHELMTRQRQLARRASVLVHLTCDRLEIYQWT
jgi:hypothetical protein